MKKKIKAMWIKALKSGKYKQGYGQLKTNDGKYCCLGVLCELHRKATKRGYKWQRSMLSNNYFGSPGSLPKIVMKWAGLQYEVPVMGRQDAISYNDGFKLTFAKIADKIKKHL